jgi:diguanylate cyclase (GGDEF)-like protein/PAS domain S-box-containing protein
VPTSRPEATFYEDISKLTGDVYWHLRTSPDEAFEYVSENVADLVGYPADDFLYGGIPFMASITHPGDQSELNRAMSVELEKSGYFELRFIHQSGHTVFTRLWFQRRSRSDGSHIVEGTVREVTQLHRLESALHDSELRFRTAMKHSAIGMMLISPAGKFLEVNPALCDLLGRDEHTLRHTTWQNLTHPGDLNKDVGLVDDVLAGRTESYRLLKRYLRPDKSVVWGDLSVSCVRDEEGRVRYFLCQVVDMTAHMQIEQELRASEEQYRLLVEESSDFIIRTAGQTGIIEWVSPAVTRVLGWSPQDAVGRPATDFLYDENESAVAQTRLLMDSGERIRDRQRIRCADGNYKWMALVGRTLFNDDGQPVARISSFQDIDAQVRAEEALVQSQAAAQHDRERLRAVMDAMIDPHFLIAPLRDDSGAIVDFEHVDANTAALDHVGMSRERFLRTRVLHMEPNRAEVIALFIRAFEQREPVIEDAMPFADPTGAGTVRLFDVRGVRVGEALSVTVRDVTQREEAAAALAESRARYRLMAENATDAVYRIHFDGTIQWLSEGVEHILGRGPEAFIGLDVDEIVYGPDQDLLDAAVDEALVTGRATVRIRAADVRGELRWLEARLHPFNDDGEMILVGGIRDVHAEMQAMAELDRRARTDHLTGLPNRDEAMSRLRLLLLGERPDPIAVAFCDLDDFKTINDTYGHASGDRWLRHVASRIREQLREGDLVARVGGDELLVVLPGVHTLDRALSVCEKLREALLSDDALSTVSIGVTLGQPGDDVDAVIARADQAMYRAKQEGRNRVVAE